MLDDNSEQLLQISIKALSMDPSEASAILIGFISVHTSTGCEYSIDVNLTRSTCFLLQQQQHSITSTSRHSAMKSSSIGDNSTPVTCSTLDMSKSRFASTQKDIGRYSNREGASLSRRADDLNTTTVTTKHQKIFFSTCDETIDYINRDYPEHDSSTAGDSPSVRSSDLLPSETKSAQPSSATPSTRSTREGLSSSTSKHSYFRVNSSQNAADLLLHFARSHDPGPLPSVSIAPTTETADTQPDSRAETLIISSTTPNKTASTTVTPTKVLISPSKKVVLRSPSIPANHHSLTENLINVAHRSPLRDNTAATATLQSVQALGECKTGVFFRKDCINYGTVAIGSLTSANVELCNGTEEVVTVLLGDPMLPFVLLHNELSLSPDPFPTCMFRSDPYP